MKRLLILMIVLVFLVPLSVSGMPPPGDTCPEETIAVPMDLTELGGTEREVLVPAEIGDLRNLYILNIVGALGPTGGQIGWIVVFGLPLPNYPAIIMLFDFDGKPRAIAIIGEDFRTDWMYSEQGCPLKTSLAEVMDMIAGMEEKPLPEAGLKV
jgi:hypothetical protein